MSTKSKFEAYKSYIYQRKRVRLAIKLSEARSRSQLRQNRLLDGKMKRRREMGSLQRKMKRSHSHEEDNTPGISSNLLANIFECPVCFDSALPPIYQCKAGHLICSTCRSKFSNSDEDIQSISCPTCRQPMDEIRNMALERISSLISFPCKYSTFGCPQNLLSSNKVTHETTCKFKSIHCPLPKSSRGSCRWQGSMTDVRQHIIQIHKDVITLAGQDIIFLAAGIEIGAPADWIMLQEAHGKTFLIVFKKRLEDGRIIFDGTTIVIGSFSDAKKFAYRLALNGNKKRLSWEAVPKSILDKKSSWESERFKIDEETAMMFAKDDDLAINVVITTTNEYTSSDEESQVSEDQD